MANGITTRSTLSLAVERDFQEKLLSFEEPDLIYKQFAEKKYIDRNSGDTARFRRYTPLTVDKVKLSQAGLPVAPEALTATDLDATVDWYGKVVAINERVVLQNQEAVLNETALLLGQWLRETEDALMRDYLISAVAVRCTGGTNGDDPTELTLGDINKVRKTLLGNAAKRFLSGIGGTNRYGTSPVRSAYIALAHTDMTDSLDNIPEFKSVINYPQPDKAIESEWGATENVRWFVSSVGAKQENASQNDATVYPMPIFGQEAFACVEQEGAQARFIYRPAYYSDALAQNVTVAAKFAQVPRFLNESWIYVLKATL